MGGKRGMMKNKPFKYNTKGAIAIQEG